MDWFIGFMISRIVLGEFVEMEQVRNCWFN